MSKIVRNTLLNYLSNDFFVETFIKSERIFNFNNNFFNGACVIYLVERELRANDNFALNFAIQKSEELNLPIKIIHLLKPYDFKLKKDFINAQIKHAKENFESRGYELTVFEGTKQELLKYIEDLTPSLMVIDFNPIENRDYLKNVAFKIYEIDGHNIIPARFLSDKQEYNAASIRRKIYFKINEFLTDFESQKRFETPAEIELKKFIKEKLDFYAEFKNNPIRNVLSGLSKYLNLGFISTQKVALEVLKSGVSDVNKEAFFEELIVRKALAENFCLYCKNYKTFDCIPVWAKETLNIHKEDYRIYVYTKSEFEMAKTHDELWNSTQKQLLKEGYIHGYLRMYWAKKILEWTDSLDTALKIAIYLNDKYAFDAPSSTGYESILWSIGGLHDRAFQTRPVTGKIRTMTFNSMKTKFDISKYINQYF